MGQWPQFKSAVFDSAATVIGFSKSRHHDWFDDQDAEACQLSDTMHAMHLAWVNDKSNSSKKSAYTRARSATQRRLRQMKNERWATPGAKASSRSEGHEGFLPRPESSVWSPNSSSVAYLYALVMVLPSSPIDKAHCLAGQNTFTVFSIRHQHSTPPC